MRNLITGYSVSEQVLFHVKGLQTLEPGTGLNYRLSRERWCIGFDAPDGQTHSCPKSERAVQGAQCMDCFYSAQIAPCLRCNGMTCGNPARRAGCVFEDHFVYLALYAPGMFKVGVTRAHRLETRIKEQGALGAIAIAAAGGQEVRRIEKAISGKDPQRWPEKVNLSALLASPWMQPQECEQQLREEAERIAERVEGVRFLPEGPFVWVADHYPRPLRVPPRHLNPATDPIAGWVEGIRGGYLLLRLGQSEQDEVVACSLASLVGREVLEIGAPEEALLGPAQGAFAF